LDFGGIAFPVRGTPGMSLLTSLKSILRGGRCDVASRFELLREAISGTMSEFYMARDRQTGNIVGLKILDAKKTADFEGRFKGLKKPSEGMIAISLDHPRIVKTFEHGITTTGQQYLVMEFIEGQGLNSLIIARSPLLARNRLRLIQQAAEAVAAVHQAGYIHRDVCPRNFVVSPDGQSLKLIDFGLTVPATAPFMQPGNRTGTPNYMAPELVRRQKTDARLDIFSFGVTAYEMCTHELPWERCADGLAAMSHATHPPVPILQRNPKLHPVLAKAISQCMEPAVNNRGPSMDHFLNQLRRVDRDQVT
jgi:serine/threonine-protein kinase